MRAIIRAAILAAIMVLGLSAVPAGAQQFNFPERVGGATKEFRSGTDERGGGYYVRYWEAGARYDVFVYDATFVPGPAGPRQQLATVVQALRLMKSVGSVQSFRQGKGSTIASKLGRFTCMTLEIEREPGSWEDSLACATSMNGFFVKLRASGPAKTGVVGRARAFLPAIAAAM